MFGWVPFRGVPARQIMEKVEVIPHVPTAVEQIVVYQCHRSCRNVKVEQLVRCTSHRCSSWLRLMMPVVVQRLVPGRDRAESCEGSAVAVLSRWSMSLLSSSKVMDVPVVLQRRRVSWKVDSVHRQSQWTFQFLRDGYAFSVVIAAIRRALLHVVWR